MNDDLHEAKCRTSPYGMLLASKKHHFQNCCLCGDLSRLRVVVATHPMADFGAKQVNFCDRCVSAMVEMLKAVK